MQFAALASQVHCQVLWLVVTEILQMASTAAAAGGIKEHHHSAPRTIKRTWSSNESTGGGNGSKACVCAPTTHAGSFKCRLHRVNSQGHSTQSAPQPAATTSSTRTVEAQ